MAAVSGLVGVLAPHRGGARAHGAVGDQVPGEAGDAELGHPVERAELAPVERGVQPGLVGGLADQGDLVVGADVRGGVLVEGADAAGGQRGDGLPGRVEALLGSDEVGETVADGVLGVAAAAGRRRTSRPGLRACGVSASSAWQTMAECPSTRER